MGGASVAEGVCRACDGFRNRDPRLLRYNSTSASKSEPRRQAAAVTRQLALLRALHVNRKVPQIHRYHLTDEGRIAVATLIVTRNVSTRILNKLAA